MVAKSTNLRLRMVAFSALAMVGSVAAQDASDSTSSGRVTGLEEIVVTARRVEERLQDVPISITVYTQEQLEDRNITTAAELGVYTPSLTTNQRFGADKASFAIRGFSMIETTSPTVAVYFADVVAPRAIAGTASGNGAGPGNFFDLQNVQVLKGPQGTLFGRNTTGGAILFVPQKPTSESEGYVEVSGGNYDLRRAQGVFNAPLTDSFRMRLGVDWQHRDGYLENHSGIGPDDFADSNYLAARASFVADITPNLENYFIARYTESDTNGIMFRMAGCNRGDDPTNPRTGRAVLLAPLGCNQVDRQAARGDGLYDVENVVPDPRHWQEEWQVLNTTTWRATDELTVRNIVSYGEFLERFYMNIGGDRLIMTTGPNAGRSFSGTTTIHHLPGQYGAAQSTFTEEFQLLGRSLGGRLAWQTGAYFELSEPLHGGNATFSETGLFCSDITQLQCEAITIQQLASLGLIRNKIAFRNIGVYGQGMHEFNDRFAITAGLRYTMDRIKGKGGRVTVRFPTPNNPVGNCVHPDRLSVITLDPADCFGEEFVEKSKEPTWVIDLQYKPLTDVMLYAKYARGYRQGGVNPSNIGVETWEPEKVDTYELGMKTTFHGGVSGTFNIAAFYNDLERQQLQATAIGCTVQTCGYNSGVPGARLIVNAGDSRIRGIEVESSISLLDGLRLDFGYAYLDTKLKEFTPPTLVPGGPYATINPVEVGGDLPFSPDHRFTASATYALPIAASLGNISFGATYVYTSSQLGGDTNPQNPFRKLPSSELVNLNFDWKSIAGSRVDLAAFVTNLTEEEVYLNVTGNWQTAGFESIVPNVPRMYGVRLKYRFGQ
jgi:iron complex outermembrane receptor protein